MLLHLEITPKELRFLTNLFLEETNIMASAWLTATLAAISTVSTGAADDAATKAAVAQLQTQMTSEQASDADFQTAITALVTKLQNSTPAAALPVVSSISPNSGPIAGGATVTLTGTGFTGATGVMFGTVAATGVTIASDTSLTAVSPALPAGQVDVTVVTPAGTSATSAADLFTAS